mgnify:CR=1 FL=1
MERRREHARIEQSNPSRPEPGRHMPVGPPQEELAPADPELDDPSCHRAHRSAHCRHRGTVLASGVFLVYCLAQSRTRSVPLSLSPPFPHLPCRLLAPQSLPECVNGHATVT